MAASLNFFGRRRACEHGRQRHAAWEQHEDRADPACGAAAEEEEGAAEPGRQQERQEAGGSQRAFRQKERNERMCTCAAESRVIDI